MTLKAFGYALSVLFTLTILSLARSKPAYAAPGVIFDSGRTQALAAYLKVPKPTLIAAQLAALPRATTFTPHSNLRPSAFPVSTPELSPGQVRMQTLNLPTLERPVFILGVDPISMRWLQRYRERLAAIGALGMVVNVATAEQFTQLKAGSMVKGAPLELYALPGSSIAKNFSLTHYPALISATRIEQ